MAKSVYTDPTPGERLLGRHVREIDREIEAVKQWHDEASQTGDTRLIRRINNALLNIESSANELRSAEVPQALTDRVSKALKNADEILASFQSLNLPTPSGEAKLNENHDGSASAPSVNEGSPRAPPPPASVALSTENRASVTAPSRSVSSKHQEAASANQAARKEHLETRCPKAVYGHRYPCPNFVKFLLML